MLLAAERIAHGFPRRVRDLELDLQRLRPCEELHRDVLRVLVGSPHHADADLGHGRRHEIGAMWRRVDPSFDGLFGQRAGFETPAVEMHGEVLADLAPRITRRRDAVAGFAPVRGVREFPALGEKGRVRPRRFGEIRIGLERAELLPPAVGVGEFDDGGFDGRRVGENGGHGIRRLLRAVKHRRAQRQRQGAALHRRATGAKGKQIVCCCNLEPLCGARALEGSPRGK